MSGLLCEVGRAGAARGVLDGGDVHPSTGALLSVAELQAALRAARLCAVTRADDPAHRGPVTGPPASEPAAAVMQTNVARHLPGAAARPTVLTPDAAPARPTAATDGLFLPRPSEDGPWLAVLGAHPQSGTSTAALALAQALAETGRQVHLVSCHEPSRCGLRSAPTRELGVDASGAWSTGARGPRLRISRPLSSPDVHTSWPQVPAADQGAARPAGPEAFTVVDMELGAPAASMSSAAAVVLTCRADAVNLACAEQVLEMLGGAARPALLLITGSGRRSGAADRYTGPLTRGLISDGRLLRMPTDRELSRFGLSGRALPAPVQRTGAAAIVLITGPSRTSRPGRSRPAGPVLPVKQPAHGSVLTPKDL